MHFCKNLYMSPSIKKHRRKVIWKLRTGRPQPLVYMIALAKGNDLLEIYHSGMLKQGYFKQKEHAPYIVGVACTYSSALELVTDILCDVYAATGDYDVKTYFQKYFKAEIND